MELDISNDAEIERLGANATAQYALIFWKRLSAAARLDMHDLDPIWEDSNLDLAPHTQTEVDLVVDGSGYEPPPKMGSYLHTASLVLSESAESDDRLYARFKSNFSFFPIADLTPPKNSSLNTERWRSLLTACHGIVEDYSFLTLLRGNVLSPFYMTESESITDLVVVPRAQFLFIEIARCRERHYGARFRRMLRVFELKTFSDLIEASLRSINGIDDVDSDSYSDEAKKLDSILNDLKKQYPLPHKSALAVSGLGRVIKKAASKSSVALEIMECWRCGLNLSNLVSNPATHSATIIEAAKFSISYIMRQNTTQLSSSSSSSSNVSTKPRALDIVGKTMNQVSKIFHENGVVYCSAPLFSPEEIRAFSDNARVGLESLIEEHLTPRNLTLEDEFDFDEVRHRPGNRLDNRYKIDVSVALKNEKVRDILDSIFGVSEGGSYKLLYSGIVHAFGNNDDKANDNDNDKGKDKDNDNKTNTPQVWHRDGPSLFDSDKYSNHHHPTHCLNIFIPLTDITNENGATEFVPTTHVDRNFTSLAPDVIKLAEKDEFSLHSTAVKPNLSAGGLVVFDIRTMHRGGCNFGSKDRDVLYMTFAFDWWVDKFMFKGNSLLDNHPNGSQNKVAVSTSRAFLTQLRRVCGISFNDDDDDKSNNSYGHPHYTARYDLLIEDDLISTDPTTKNRGMQNSAAVMKFFCSLTTTEQTDIIANFVSIWRDTDANTINERKMRILSRQSANQTSTSDEDDFGSILDDLSDVDLLYKFACELSKPIMQSLGFSEDSEGFLVMLALLKAAKTKAQTDLSECLSNYWFIGPSRVSWMKKSATKENVIVVFSSLGSGVARPEWGGTLRKIGVMDTEGYMSMNEEFKNVSVLSVLDPAFSWYNQDPTGEWRGGEYYEKLITGELAGYKKVMVMGDSMGGAGALRFCHLADACLVFTPQIDLRGYSAVKRLDFGEHVKVKFMEKIVENVRKKGSAIEIHYGEFCDVDSKQVGLLGTDGDGDGDGDGEGEHKVVKWDFDDHILSVELKKRGVLMDVVGTFIETWNGNKEKQKWKE